MPKIIDTPASAVRAALRALLQVRVEKDSRKIAEKWRIARAMRRAA